MTKRLILLPVVFAFCAARTLGRMAKRNKLVWLLGFAAVTLWALVSVQNNGVFELDGNAFHNAAHDWDQVYADSLTNPPGTTSGAAAIAFDPDLFNTGNDNIFQGGGSKDTNGIQEGPWLWTTSKPQPKDDLIHSYAAAYTIQGDLILFVGADRYSNNGDSTIAFWFFQDGTVGLANTKQGGGLTFTGHHTNNDLLLISDFTVGGSTPVIHAFVWQGDDATGTLVDKGVLAAGTGFAIVNGSNAPSPWTFNDKGNTGGGNTFAPGEFFEGGVDITALFGAGNVPCFATFMAETRSSQSPTATLSDFTPPRSFPLCGMNATKTCSGGQINSDGKTVTYSFSGTIHNIGIGTLTGLAVSDTPGKQADGTVVFSQCSGPVGQASGQCWGNLVLNQPASTTLGPNATATYSGSFDTNFVAPSTFPNIAVASAGAGGNTVTASGDWSGSVGTGVCAPVPQAGLSLTKSCTTTVTSGNPISVTVNLTGTVTNNCSGSGCVDVSAITVTDTPTTTVTVDCSVTPPGTTCQGANGTLFLSPGASANLSGSLTNATCAVTDSGNTGGRCIFSDTFNASGTGSLGVGAVTALPAPATCSLCPNGACGTGN